MSYDDTFYEAIAGHAQRSADVIVPIVLMRLKQAEIRVQSVIDVGGGQGWWAKAFGMYGSDVRRLLCIDGDYVKDPVVPFMAQDLEKSLAIPGDWDLAVCLEVGEHLTHSRAHSLVLALTLVAPVVLFSAAIPEQGGNNHINEQPPLYWAHMFASNGFYLSGFLRDAVWNDDRVSSWYRQNLMLAVRNDHKTPPGYWDDAPPKERIHPATGNPRLKEQA